MDVGEAMQRGEEATAGNLGWKEEHLESGKLDDVELPRRGDDAGRAGAADVGEERVEEGAVGGDGAALERVALVEDAAAQEELLARRGVVEGAGSSCALWEGGNRFPRLRHQLNESQTRIAAHT